MVLGTGYRKCLIFQLTSPTPRASRPFPRGRRHCPTVPLGIVDGRDAVRRADAVVVGAGTAGAGAALQLARRGMEVVLLDRRPTERGGAQWRNGVRPALRAGRHRPAGWARARGRPRPDPRGRRRRDQGGDPGRPHGGRRHRPPLPSAPDRSGGRGGGGRRRRGPARRRGGTRPDRRCGGRRRWSAGWCRCCGQDPSAPASPAGSTALRRRQRPGWRQLALRAGALHPTTGDLDGLAQWNRKVERLLGPLPV